MEASAWIIAWHNNISKKKKKNWEGKIKRLRKDVRPPRKEEVEAAAD